MQKILLIEDGEKILNCWKRWFEVLLKKDKLLLIFATSISEAREKFKLNPDVVLIVVDGCIEGSDERPNTQELVIEFRKTFTGPRVAQSGDEEYMEILQKAGCDYQCRKEDVPQMVVDILGLK